ncbi:MAG: hypothetical protein IPG35_05060 [Flavobacteriales bacterium]|nr:hypothetical protein [Flavobacteriales bacterium]MBK9698633.1 hypothetical protein [Flavobacteriales bacterium]
MERRRAHRIGPISLLLCALLPACRHTGLEAPKPGPGSASDILFLDPEPDPFTSAPWWGPVRIDLDQDSVVAEGRWSPPRPRALLEQRLFSR